MDFLQQILMFVYSFVCFNKILSDWYCRRRKKIWKERKPRTCPKLWLFYSIEWVGQDLFRNSGKLGPANSMKQDNFFKLTLLKRRGAHGLTGKKSLITTDSLTDWLQDLLTGCLIDWPADWLTDWPTDCLIDCLMYAWVAGQLASHDKFV